MKDVYQFRELMEKMSKVDEKFEKCIHVVNVTLFRLIKPFLKNLLILPVTEMNKIAWITSTSTVHSTKIFFTSTFVACVMMC